MLRKTKKKKRKNKRNDLFDVNLVLIKFNKIQFNYGCDHTAHEVLS